MAASVHFIALVVLFELTTSFALTLPLKTVTTIESVKLKPELSRNAASILPAPSNPLSTHIDNSILNADKIITESNVNKEMVNAGQHFGNANFKRDVMPKITATPTHEPISPIIDPNNFYKQETVGFKMPLSLSTTITSKKVNNNVKSKEIDFSQSVDHKISIPSVKTINNANLNIKDDFLGTDSNTIPSILCNSSPFNDKLNDLNPMKCDLLNLLSPLPIIKPPSLITTPIPSNPSMVSPFTVKPVSYFLDLLKPLPFTPISNVLTLPLPVVSNIHISSSGLIKTDPLPLSSIPVSPQFDLSLAQSPSSQSSNVPTSNRELCTISPISSISSPKPFLSPLTVKPTITSIDLSNVYPKPSLYGSFSAVPFDCSSNIDCSSLLQTAVDNSLLNIGSITSNFPNNVVSDFVEDKSGNCGVVLPLSVSTVKNNLNLIDMIAPTGCLIDTDSLKGLGQFRTVRGDTIPSISNDSSILCNNDTILIENAEKSDDDSFNNTVLETNEEIKDDDVKNCTLNENNNIPNLEDFTSEENTNNKRETDKNNNLESLMNVNTPNKFVISQTYPCFGVQSVNIKFQNTVSPLLSNLRPTMSRTNGITLSNNDFSNFSNFGSKIGLPSTLPIPSIKPNQLSSLTDSILNKTSLSKLRIPPNLTTFGPSQCLPLKAVDLSTNNLTSAKKNNSVFQNTTLSLLKNSQNEGISKTFIPNISSPTLPSPNSLKSTSNLPSKSLFSASNSVPTVASLKRNNASPFSSKTFIDTSAFLKSLPNISKDIVS